MMAAWVKCLYYNPTTQVLTYENIPGKSLANILSLLQNLTIQKVDQHGNALWLDADQTIPATTTVSAINSATAQALLNQYNSQGALPVTANGYSIGGGGKFMVSARNIDLGTSAGIISKGAGLYSVGGDYLLRNYSSVGADILVNLIGSLDILSSSVASLNGGNIYINAGGDVNVGSTEFVVNTLGARGVYSSGLGNVG